MMQARGVAADHAGINRWVLKYSPQLEEALHRRKRPVSMSWHVDETSIRVCGQWCYLYHAVDKTGQIIDFLLTGQRGEWSAMRFLTKVEQLMRRLLFERRRQHADAGDVEHTACPGFITGVDDPGHPFPIVQMK